MTGLVRSGLSSSSKVYEYYDANDYDGREEKSKYIGTLLGIIGKIFI